MLICPDELHLLNNDYPLAPGKLGLPDDMADYCKNSSRAKI